MAPTSCCAGFLGLCSSVRRRSSGQLRQARRLRQARDACVELQKSASVGPQPLVEEGLPVQHLRAAAQHLAIVEAWLRMHSTGVQDASSKQLSVKGDMWLAGDLDPKTEDEDQFVLHFSPVYDGEVLIAVMPCLIKSHSFRHLGKLYLSSARLCLYSSVWGAKICGSFPWDKVQGVQLMSRSAAKIYPVRIFLTSSLDFDGTNSQHVDVSFFDQMALGQVDRCAYFFVGSGLFDSAQSNCETPPQENWRSASLSPASLGRRSSLVLGLDGEDTKYVWQLERRTTIWSADWRAPFLPHDGAKQIKWVDGQYCKHPFIPDSIPAQTCWVCRTPPIDEIELLGEMHQCTWHVIQDTSTDNDGWQYAVDFYRAPESWTSQPGNFSHVRRRRWQPSFDISAVSPSAGGPQAKAERTKTTILAEKELQATSQQLFEVTLGKIPLESLAAAFEAEDWLQQGGLMSRYFAMISASDLEVGPWQSGEGVLSQVKGKARSIDMRIPVPPAPMCPEFTSCDSIFHVVTSPMKVVLESVTMSLDVPCGKSFKVVTVDTYDLVDQNVRMARDVAIDWVGSVWGLKGMIESGVHAQVTSFGQQWAKIVQEWAQSL